MNQGNGISCNDFRDSLSDWLDGIATGERRNALEKHLEGCSDCARVLERERGFFALLGSLEREPAPAGFAQRTLDRLLPALAPQPIWSGRRRASSLMLAAAIVLLIGALGQWFSPVTGAGGGTDSLRDTATLALVEGSREVPGVLQFFEQTGDRIRQITGPTLAKMHSLIRAERTVRSLIPPGAFALFLLVSLTPLVLFFTVYRLRFKGALSHVLVIPSFR